MTTLAEIKALEEAATSAPWEVDGECIYGLERNGLYGNEEPMVLIVPAGRGADARLAAASRNLLPKLLKLWAAAESYEDIVESKGGFGEPDAYAMMRAALRELEGDAT